MKLTFLSVIITFAVNIHGPLVKRPKTPPSHGGNRGSSPLWVTRKNELSFDSSFFCAFKGGLEPGRHERKEKRVAFFSEYASTAGKPMVGAGNGASSPLWGSVPNFLFIVPSRVRYFHYYLFNLKGKFTSAKCVI